MYEDILEGIGLTKGEIKVYLTLLKLGETTTGKIIDDSGLSSGKIYEILNKLMKKGLVNYIVKEKTKYFNATSPKKILEYISNTEKEIKKKRQQVEKILPSLSSIKDKKREEYSAVVYKGIEGFKTAIYETLDELNKDNKWLAFGISVKRKEIINRIWNKFVKAKEKKGISSRLIFNDIKSYKGQKPKYKEEGRILKMISNAAPVSISGNIVMIYNWKELSVIKITNKDIAQSFREFFYNLWDMAKKPKL